MSVADIIDMKAFKNKKILQNRGVTQLHQYIYEICLNAAADVKYIEKLDDINVHERTDQFFESEHSFYEFLNLVFSYYKINERFDQVTIHDFPRIKSLFAWCINRIYPKIRHS